MCSCPRAWAHRTQIASATNASVSGAEMAVPDTSITSSDRSDASALAALSTKMSMKALAL